MKKLKINSYTLFCGIILASIHTLIASLPQPVENYYSIKDYGAPHFHPESLSLDTEAFIELVNQVNEKTKDRAFLIEVPNELYSENIQKLRAAQFFHYHDFPEHNSSIWCRTNGSGIPLAGSHTFGARAVVYYKDGPELYFLLVKDKYIKHYEFPGGYIQPEDQIIINNFEQGLYTTPNLDYRSPTETAISETLEETGFNLENYNYGPQGSKKPLTIAQVYTKNTRPDRGIHSLNDACQYLLFKVQPNNDPLQKQEHEIEDTLWASYTQIINNQIPSPTHTHSVNNNTLQIIQRIMAGEQYKENRQQLHEIDQEIETLLCNPEIKSDSHFNTLLTLTTKRNELTKQQKNLERKLKQSHTQNEKQSFTYYTPF